MVVGMLQEAGWKESELGMGMRRVPDLSLVRTSPEKGAMETPRRSGLPIVRFRFNKRTRGISETRGAASLPTLNHTNCRAIVRSPSGDSKWQPGGV